MVCATTTLVYSKWPCVCFKVNICYTCCIISSFQNLLLPSIATLWPVTITVTVSCGLWQLWQWCHAQNPNSSSQNRKSVKKKINMKNKIKRNLGLMFTCLTLYTTHSWVNLLSSSILKFLIFLWMPLSVEMMFLERICVQIYLVITLVVQIFEDVRA